ncbi:DUF3347 domain-containing protein [Algoriphagus sp. SE2]|uniref:DUF3347 domain-containing protein n=1 Tax=Algoriphagus sp. SE2 TaxID=3141536 RepID=UPI0031CD6FF6
MKILTKTLFITLSISLAIACKQNTQNEETEVNLEHNEQMDHSSKPTAGVSFENENVSAIVNSYLALKDALVETDGEKAKSATSELVSILATSNLEGISEMEVEVKKITETADPEVQRTSFDVISNQMVQLVKNSVLTEGKLYKQYCPMAKNNEGAFWISASNEIRNPYFGDKMLKCGSVEEEI